MTPTKTHRRTFLASALAASCLSAKAQQASPPYQPKQSDRPEAIPGGESGFRPIFNGKNLDGWEGDPKYWRVEENKLVGEITPDTIIKSNTFIIWRGGSPADFEIKADYRITAGGNSGINYRSIVVPDAVTPANKFAMRGYQADIDGKNTYTGQNYEEKGRLFLATRGEMTHVVPGRKPVLLASLGDSKDLAAFITNDWNSYHLIIRGNVLTHILNGHVMCVVIDDDPAGRKMSGLIGVQVHVGPPMKVEYRDFMLKEL
jgi:3-keto-disaccharide hydrolase